MDIDKLITKAEELQNEMNEFIERMHIASLKRGSKVSYEDFKTIFFLTKIADLQQQVDNLVAPPIHTSNN